MTITSDDTIEPRFIKLYIDDVCQLKNIGKTPTEIFYFMLQNMNHENIVSVGTHTKGKFLDRHNMMEQTYKNNIPVLIKSGLIERVGRGEFRVNKKYAVKVKWKDVKSIEWLTKYTENGKIETVKVTRKKKQQ